MKNLFAAVALWLSAAFVSASCAAESQLQSSALIVDHRVIGEKIPEQYLDRARNLNVIFGHNSVGNNIMQGVFQLSRTQPEQFSLQIAHYGNPAWLGDHHGVLDFQVGRNGSPEAKISDFAERIKMMNGQNINVAMMKLCYVDINLQTDAGQVWNDYRATLENLERRFPTVVFVWCTCPLVSNQNNQRREEFNNFVRSYCRQNKQILFDIADIESHDPQGLESRNQFGPNLCPQYSMDGGHPNSPEAMQRFALAWWSLMSRIAGWRA